MSQFVEFLADQFYWVFLGILLLNVFQRRHHETAVKKRFATLYLGSAAFVIFLMANAVVEYRLPDFTILLGIVAVIAVLYVFRRHTFPFTLTCRHSGKRLDMHTILFRDSNILPEFDEAGPGADEAGQGTDEAGQGTDEADDVDEADQAAHEANVDHETNLDSEAEHNAAEADDRRREDTSSS
jgi:hypothetical protein